MGYDCIYNDVMGGDDYEGEKWVEREQKTKKRGKNNNKKSKSIKKENWFWILMY